MSVVAGFFLRTTSPLSQTAYGYETVVSIAYFRLRGKGFFFDSPLNLGLGTP